MSKRSIGQLVVKILGLSLVILLLLSLIELATFLALPTLSIHDLSRPINELAEYAPRPQEDSSSQFWSGILKESEPILGRSRIIDLQPEEMFVTLQLSVDKSTRLAQEIVRDGIEIDLTTFVETAFGTITIDDEPLGPLYREVSWDIQENQDLITASLTTSIQTDSFPFISLQPPLPEENDLVVNRDSLTIHLENTVLRSISVVPDLANSDIVSITNLYPDSLGSVWISLQREVERPNVTVTRQGFLRALGGRFNTDWINALMFGIVEFIPVFLVLYFWRTKDSLFSQSQQLKNILWILILFHFTIYTLYSLDLYLAKLDWINKVSASGNALLRYLGSSTRTPLFGDSPQVLNVAVAGVLLPSLFFLHSRNRLPREQLRNARLINWFIVFVILVIILATIVSIRDLLKPTDRATLPLWSVLMLSLCVTALLMALGFRALYSYLWGRGKPVIRPDIPLLTTLAVYLLIFIDFTWAIQNQYLQPWLGRDSEYTLFFLVTIVFGGIFLHSIFYVIRTNFPALDFANRSPGWVRTLAFFVPFLLAAPIYKIPDATMKLAYQTSLLSLAFEIDNLIIHALMIGIFWYLAQKGADEDATRSRNQPALELTALTRSLGLLALAVIVFNPGQVWRYIPLRFLAGWLLLNVIVRKIDYWKKIKAYFMPVVINRLDLLEKIVNFNAATSAYRSYRKEQKDKLSKGEISIAAYARALDERQLHLENYQETLKIKGRSGKELALAFGPFKSAWMNGKHGVKWAAVFSLPWLIIFMTRFLGGRIGVIPYPLLDFLENLISVVGPWLAMGFLLGYYYPYIRGNNGLQKSLWMAGAVILPSLMTGLIYNATAEAWQATLFWALQVFIHCILLGLIAFDYYTLRQGYNDWRMLFDVHGLPEISISISSLGAAIIAAIAALVSNQAPGLIGDVVKGLLSPDIFQFLP